MRLFIAAELPETVEEALAETSALLRGQLRGRYVASDSYHVTLAFMGDVATGRVARAVEALEAGCRGVVPFGVTLGELGTFGRRAKATLWQGFADSGQLPNLAEAVCAELRQRDLPYDEKPFRAHVTLMRAVNLSEGVLPWPMLAEGHVENIALFKSDLSGPRPLYEALHVVRLR